MQKPRLVLADDHQLLVDGMLKILEPEYDVVETVRDGRAAVEAFERLRPDLLLLDIGLPLLNGIEAARQVKRIAPAARILFVTMHPDRVYVEEALRAGGAGYVLKQAAARELVDAIRVVLTGRLYVSPEVASRMARGTPSEALSAAQWGGHLTPRQREVLQLVAEGKSMKEIAAILKISVRTVEFHKNGIMEQLGFRTTAELTRYALDHGITVKETLSGGNTG
jgi:DNA-binding NarL/FixJ family response regulator